MSPRVALVLVLMLSTALISNAVDASTTPIHKVDVPGQIGEGDDREVTVLVDTADLKLATVTLRRGTVLPAHSTPVPATLHVLEGRGTIHVGDQPVAVSTGSIVILAADEEHDVVPAPDTDMLVLVHYLRTAASGDPHRGHAHEHSHSDPEGR